MSSASSKRNRERDVDFFLLDEDIQPVLAKGMSTTLQKLSRCAMPDPDSDLVKIMIATDNHLGCMV